MGCFAMLKHKKKKSNQTMNSSQRGNHNEPVPAAVVLPKPPTQTRTLQSYAAAPGLRSSVNSIHPINKLTINNRARALSAPSALDAAEQDALSSIKYEEQQESKCRARSMKEEQHQQQQQQHSPSTPQPQPLPLPSDAAAALKALGSLKYAVAAGSEQAHAFASVEYEGQQQQEYYKRRVVASMMELQKRSPPSPQPLPLPCPQSGAPLKVTTGGSFKSETVIESVRYFPFEEIAAACNNFSSDHCMSECHSSTIYKASFGGDDVFSSSRKIEATVNRLRPSSQGLREFINEVNTLASLQHPNICKLVGFHAREDDSGPRMLIYERLCHGSLDHLLFGKSDGPSIDWNTRLKIAICAAQGLTYLHEEGPFQAMYGEFSTASIQVDKDFNAKLSGYGCVGHIPPQEEISTNSSTLEKGMLTPKSNVWSFGVVLLELLTGRKKIDNDRPEEERNLVKWFRPFLAGGYRLVPLLVDPQLKGRFPGNAARTVAEIAQRCLQKEPSERPTMRIIVEHLKMILQDMNMNMNHSCLYPLQEPAEAMYGKHILARSPSVNDDGITCHAAAPPRLSLSPSVGRTPISPPRWSGVPTTLLPPPPPLACSSNFSMKELNRMESKKSSSSLPNGDSVEGY